MAEIQTIASDWRFILPEGMHARLMAHLFPGDNDEHGAIILAGVAESDRGSRLIARSLHLAEDGTDYVAGQYGYRMLRAQFIQPYILQARDQRLAYLAIHNHGGTVKVQFSEDDFASHERGYPALLDIARGMPVGALVFAQKAIAGELWFSNRKRIPLRESYVIGQNRTILYPNPPDRIRRSNNGRYSRQSLLFGQLGQEILSETRVGIIGLGGAGSILAELLGRLGVAEFVLADPDVVEGSNLPRLIAAKVEDADPHRPSYKIDIAARNILNANPQAKIQKFAGDFVSDEVARKFTDCDYLFLSADTMRARLVFNAIVHQYGIPGQQVGAKVRVDSTTGQIGDVFTMSRPVTPEHGCLLCNGLINFAALQNEAISEEERTTQRYVEDTAVAAPSVITLNAIACAHAANDFLFFITGLKSQSSEADYFRFMAKERRVWYDKPRADPFCLECGLTPQSRLSLGDGVLLPTRLA